MHLEKVPHVEHDVSGICGAQRLQRIGYVAELPVVVVLDDERPMLSRAKLTNAARRFSRHGHAEGKLMRRTKRRSPPTSAGKRSTMSPSSSTGTATMRAPAAANATRIGGYPGSSIATNVLPGVTMMRASKSKACCAPEVTTTSSGRHTTARVSAMWHVMASRR